MKKFEKIVSIFGNGCDKLSFTRYIHTYDTATFLLVRLYTRVLRLNDEIKKNQSRKYSVQMKQLVSKSRDKKSNYSD